MAKTLKIGIIGCGGIANGKHMPALSRIKEVELAAFCDIIPEKAEEAKTKYGTKHSKTYVDYKELLKDKNISVVHVCTPNNSHAEISIAALKAKKHVMCEKPMAASAADARAMLKAANDSGMLLTIGYQNRQRGDSRYLKGLCEAGELGEIYFAKGHAIRRRAVPTWGVFLDEEKQGGGPLIDIGTHALDLTLWMMDNYEVKSVMGNVYHKLSQTKNAANAWGPWDPAKFTVEDSAFGFITMKNGATIILESSWALNSLDVDEAKCTLCGTKAGADMKNGLKINGEKNSRLYDMNVELRSGGAAFYEGASNRSEDVEARQWIDAVLSFGTSKAKKPTVLPEQALVVSEILEAIYTSAKTGQPVYFADSEAAAPAPKPRTPRAKK